MIHVTHSSRTEYLAIKQSDIGSFKKYSQLKSSVVEDGTDQIVEVFDSLVGNFTSEVSRNSEINYGKKYILQLFKSKAFLYLGSFRPSVTDSSYRYFTHERIVLLISKVA